MRVVRVLSAVGAVVVAFASVAGAPARASAVNPRPAVAFVPCWTESYNDSPNAGVIDIRQFSLQYDCEQHYFELHLAASNPIDNGLTLIKALVLNFDVDGNSHDGCSGADFRMEVATVPGGGLRFPGLLATPSCAGSSWFTTGFVGEDPGPDQEHVSFTFVPTDLSTNDLVDPGSFRWWGSITQWADPNQTDRFPDNGAIGAGCYHERKASLPFGGYWLAKADGTATGLGTAHLCGDSPPTGGVRAVGITATPDRRGTWTVDAAGGVATFGDAPFFGSAGALHLSRPIVGMAPTPSGNGYWLVASDGGIFSYGDAKFYGSTGAIRLNRAIVGMAATPTGHGYWLVASDGGIFSYGDAKFFGSTGAIRLNRPIVGMARSHAGKGYWLVASDGGVFAFGDADFHGSTGAIRLASPIVGLAATASGNGYRFVANDGGIFCFGDAGYSGSLAGAPLPPGGVVGIAP